MNQATPKIRNFAGRLIAHDAKGKVRGSPIEKVASFPVGEKLRPHLASLMGNTGYRALLSRSLALAGTEVRWLRKVQVGADGTLDFDSLNPEIGETEIAEGMSVLLAHLLGLLVAFIGEILMLRLVREIWPRLPLNDYFNQETTDEKTT